LPQRELKRTNQPEANHLLINGSAYPFFDILWTTLIFFAWVIFIWIAITVLIDVFRRHDISGWGKAGWVILIVILPWIGVLIYLIANHGGMTERRAKDVATSQAQFDEAVRKAAGTTGTTGGGGAASEIEKAKQLLDSGAITQAEFDSIKAKALAA
jgi:Short C-terminal domain/Phospholipase_D-nuclease N-terminal